MGFWIYMLIMVLLIPATMLGLGKHFINKAPKEINYIFGYRTNLSMKNEETWEFAHNYCGGIWFKCGLVLLPLSIVLMLFVIGKSDDAIGTLGGIMCVVQLIPILASIVLAEKALKKNFDEDGKRKNGESE